MILPLPRTGPSSCWRLQFTTKTRLSSSSRAARPIAPSDSGSPISPSPRNAHTCWSEVSLMLAVLEIAVEARLVDRVEGGQAHRDGGELPEVRHQPGVGVRRQAVARTVLDLLPEPVELVLGEPALEEGAGVDAGRPVALDVDLVAAAGCVLAAEEVVEADLVEAGRRLVGRDVAADLEALAVGAGDHDRGVPADERADPALDVLVAGEPRLALGRDRVDVVGAAERRDTDLLLAGPLEQPQHDVAGPVAAALLEHAVEGLEPVAGLLGVDVGQLGGEALVDHRGTRAARPRCCGGVVVSSLTGPSLHAGAAREIPGVALVHRFGAVARDGSLGLSLRSRPRAPNPSPVLPLARSGQGSRLAHLRQLRWTTPH